MARQTVSDEVREAIKGVLNQELAGCGVTGISILPDVDHSGDEALFVTVDYDSEGDSIDLNLLASLTTKVRDRLWNMGEERFPYIRSNFTDPYDDEDELNDQ